MASLVSSSAKEAPFQIAEIHASRGEPDAAFEWLDRAYAERDGGLAEILGNPFLETLEADPRYEALLARLRLPLPNLRGVARITESPHRPDPTRTSDDQ